MKKNMRLTFQKGDFLAIVPVLLFAAIIGILFLPCDTEEKYAKVQIYQDGRLIQEISLEEERSIELVGNYTNVVEIENGRVAIVESDCPGEDCVYSGFINSVGRTIICLPNRVEIRIVGEAEVDFVVG